MEGESERDRRLRLEDAWIAAQGGDGEFGINFTATQMSQIGGAFGRPAANNPLGFPGAGLRERSLLMDTDGGGSDQVGLPRDFVWG